MPIAVNPDTGEVLRLDDQGAWVKAQQAQNPQTGETLVYDGEAWVPTPTSPTEALYADQASKMSDDEVFMAKMKKDPFGEYLYQRDLKPRQGESEADHFKRLHGYSKPEPVGMGEGIARAGLQGSSFGSGDEAVAASAAGVQSLAGGGDFDKLYEAYLAREREKIDRFREESPVAAYGSEALGAIPSAIATGGASTGSLVARTFTSGGIGAIQGGLYGFNAGEGGAGNRAQEAGYGAALGGLLGAGAEPVADIGKAALGRFLRGRSRNSVSQFLPADLTMGKPEYDILARNVIDDPRAVQRGVQNLRRGGSRAMLANADPYYAGLLDESVNTGGRAGAAAREAIDDRVADVGSALTGTMDDVLGTPQGVKTTAKRTAQATAGARDAAYEQAYNLPIDYSTESGKAVEDIFNRLSGSHVRQAIKEANAQMKWDGRPFQILADVADDGTVTFEKMPGVLELDYVKRALGDLGFAPGGPKIAQKQAMALRDALVKAVPDYEAALGLGQDNILKRQAIEAGANALRPSVTRETFAEAVEKMRPEDLALARQGVRSSIDDALANVKAAMTDPDVDARETAKLLKDLSSRASREKMSMILDPKEAARLWQSLDEAAEAFRLRAAVAQNSKTQPREAMARIKKQAAKSPLRSLLSGRLVDAAQEGVSTVTGNTERAQQLHLDQIDQSLAEILTRVRGDKAEGLLKELGRTAPRTEMLPEQTRQIGQMLLRSQAAPTSANWEYPRKLLGR